MSKIGFTCGAFDLLHAGHILMLEECKEVCDYLIVGLQTDPSIDRLYKHTPIQTLKERMIQLEAVKYVDEVVTYETEEDLIDLLNRYRSEIYVRILGADWRGASFTGHEMKDIRIYFNKRDHGYSSTELINRIKSTE
jgi:glycerol-3-phosphate cytidylyltransferase